MAINRINPNHQLKKRLFKRISALLIVIMIPVSIILTLYYTLGGKEKGNQLKLANKIYSNIFVNKSPFEFKNDITNDVSLTIDEIYGDYKNVDTSNKLPKYTQSIQSSFLTKNGKNIFQFVDSDFEAGTGIFKSWNKIVIIEINNEDKIESIQYKNGTN